MTPDTILHRYRQGKEVVINFDNSKICAVVPAKSISQIVLSSDYTGMCLRFSSLGIHLNISYKGTLHRIHVPYWSIKSVSFRNKKAAA